MRKIAVLLITPALAIGGMLAGASAAHALSTPTQIADDINAVSSAAQNLSKALTAISTSASPQQVTPAGQDTAAGLNAMISSLAADVTALQGTFLLDAGDAHNVADAFAGQVVSMQQLLATLTAKHGIFAQFGLTAPLAAALRSLEGAVDTIAHALIDAAPTEAADFTQQQDALDKAIADGISSYEQICIPSPLYPTVMPVCVGL